MYFLALSQAPPPLAIISPSSTPVTVAPTSRPPRAFGPRNMPTTTGAITALSPGKIISFKAAVEEMSTQRAGSGLPVPSISPGISRNWRRISLTILKAVLPTASIVCEAIKKGRTPPMKTPATTTGSVRVMLKLSTPWRWATVLP